MVGWYYLHENGDLIYKRFEPEVEPGGFVRKVWKFDSTNRFDAWRICIEALVLGARQDRIDELVLKWGLTDEDGKIFVDRSEGKLLLSRDGDRWRATFGDFVDLQKSQAGFGTTVLDALVNLARPGLMSKFPRKTGDPGGKR